MGLALKMFHRQRLGKTWIQSGKLALQNETSGLLMLGQLLVVGQTQVVTKLSQVRAVFVLLTPMPGPNQI